MDIAEQVNGESRKLEPFHPGTFEEYDLLDDGTTKLIRRQIYHGPGDRPSFKPFVLYEGLLQPPIIAFTHYKFVVELSSDPLKNIRTLLTSAVRKRLMADRRIGCFLSGGLDSSLIAALLVQEAKKANLPYKIQVGSLT